MRLYLTFSLLFIFIGNSLHGQSFKLKEADTIKLKLVQNVLEYSQSIGYLYLKENYSVKSDKGSVEYYEWSIQKEICAFQQEFESGIHYSVWQCKEAGGISEQFIFPKIDKNELKVFIETLFWDAFNVWISDSSYQPEGAGCYYEIIETDIHSILDVYCGC